MRMALYKASSGSETFPDISDGGDYAAYNSRCTLNVGKIKKIGNAYYIHLEGHISFSTSGSAVASWTICVITSDPQGYIFQDLYNSDGCKIQYVDYEFTKQSTGDADAPQTFGITLSNQGIIHLSVRGTVAVNTDFKLKCKITLP